MLTEQKIIEGNKLCSEFMGLKFYYDYGYNGDKRLTMAIEDIDGDVGEPCYHDDWNWLIPVWAKFHKEYWANYQNHSIIKTIMWVNPKLYQFDLHVRNNDCGAAFKHLVELIKLLKTV